MRRSAITRFAAILLLLLVGGELFACELLAPAGCESFGLPGATDPSAVDDDCLCCCPHVVVVAAGQLQVTFIAHSAPPSPDPHRLDRQAPSVYHPPKP